MKPKRKQRLYFILIMLMGITAAVSLAIYALGENVNVYYTPAQITENKAPLARVIRMGGMVEQGSLKRFPGSLEVRFVLTNFVNSAQTKAISHENTHEVLVHYSGILPVLFREGQGVVVQGKLNQFKDGKVVFVADQVLAKHDEKYMPPKERE